MDDKKEEKKVTAFKCTRTGMLFPADYAEKWGREYGIGLGPVPVSEALTNLYDQRAVAREGYRNTMMYPVGVSRAPIVAVEVTESEYKEKLAILHRDDPSMATRAGIMRGRQIAHNRITKESEVLL